MAVITASLAVAGCVLAWGGFDWLWLLANRPAVRPGLVQIVLPMGLVCWVAFVSAGFVSEWGRARSSSPSPAMIAIGIRTGGVAIAALALVLVRGDSIATDGLFCLLVFYSVALVVDTIVWTRLLRRESVPKTDRRGTAD